MRFRCREGFEGARGDISYSRSYLASASSQDFIYTVAQLGEDPLGDSLWPKVKTFERQIFQALLLLTSNCVSELLTDVIFAVIFVEFFYLYNLVELLGLHLYHISALTRLRDTTFERQILLALPERILT